MKYLKHIFVSCLMTGMLLSCDALDYKPEDYYGSSTFWDNEAQVDGFMVGIHKNLRDINEYIFLFGEARGGTQRTGSGTQGVSYDYSSPIKDNNFTYYNTGVSNWAKFYPKILNINEFIYEVENNCDFLDTAVRNYYLGQAYGVRAYLYFHLYRTFGGVPVVKDPDVMNGITNAGDLYQARATAKQTLDFIKEDITKSETAFGDDETVNLNKGMWSKAATMALKGEVYLWSAKVTTDDQSPASGDIATAKNALSGLIGKYRLLDDYADVFAYENKGNDEVIMALRFVDGEKSNWIYNFTYTDADFLNKFYGVNGLLITSDTLVLNNQGKQRHEWKEGFFKSYDDKDMRKREIFLDYYDQEGNYSGTVLRKCLGTINAATNKRVFSDDYVIYRYADVLLMMAEVVNMEGGDVASYLNQVRKRAYGSNYDESVYGYTNGTFEKNELAILYERDKEFVWEGKRWYDIRRMWDANHKPLVFSSEVNYDTQEPVVKESDAYKLLWPIDIETLNKDPELVNNPGYMK